MHVLTNNIISIKVASRGAELQSLYNKNTGIEYMWNAGPEWPKVSPVLFPIVGGLKKNQYQYNDRTYMLNRHGFAREMEFDLIAQETNSLTFLLKSNDKTLEHYPFQFSFYIKYTLHGSQLQVGFIVVNKEAGQMLFSVGAHPAFAVPLVSGTLFEDYFLEFDAIENTERWPLTAEGLIETASVSFLSGTSKLPLKKELFYNDAIVFKDLQSKHISLKSDRTEHGLIMGFDGFPYMGIWAAKNADFVCIEPWCGIADGVHASGMLSEKEGIQAIREGGSSFERSYTIKTF